MQKSEAKGSHATGVIVTSITVSEEGIDVDIEVDVGMDSNTVGVIIVGKVWGV